MRVWTHARRVTGGSEPHSIPMISVCFFLTISTVRNSFELRRRNCSLAELASSASLGLSSPLESRGVAAAACGARISWR